MAERDHEGRRADFCSIRHAHGTALAEACVREKDIATSMHRTNRSMTAQYLQANRRLLRAAIDAMPDLSYP